MSRSRNSSLPALNDSRFHATDTTVAVFNSPLETTVQLCRYFVRANNLGSYLRHRAAASQSHSPQKYTKASPLLSLAQGEEEDKRKKGRGERKIFF